MDFIIQREALLKPLQAVSGVVEKKQTLPILSNVLIKAGSNKLLLVGTDLEVELIGFAAVQSIAADGKITVSARKLFDICRSLPDDSTLHLMLEKNHLVVRAGDSVFMLNTLPVEEFPSLETVDYPTQFSLPQADLKDLFTKVYFAMGQQDVRHYLNGALLDIAPHSIKCVAADGHRLALSSITSESIGDVRARVILPRKSVMELIRMLDSDDDRDVVIEIAENRVRVTSPDFNFTTKLINAQYPDYNRLIPRGNSVALGEREPIKQALTRASILSNEKFRGVRFQLATNRLTITANNADQEQAEDAVSLEYAGDNLEMGFNVAYLIDIVSSITSKSIRCIFTDQNNGVLIEPADGDTSLYVVMPMRL